MDFFLTLQEREKYGDAVHTIPWFGGDHDTNQKYPVVPFEEYLLVRGVPPEKIQNFPDWIQSNPDEALPLMQAWLFFGVLESALFDSFGGKKHFKDTPGGKVLNTYIIQGMEMSWELRISGLRMSIAQWQERWTKTRIGAEAVSFRLAGLTRGEMSLSEDTEAAIDEIVRMSLLLMEHMMAIMPAEVQRGPGLPTLITIRTPGMEERYRARLLSQGWCPSMYQTLGKISGSLTLVEYACVFPATDFLVERHEKCTEETCIAYNMDVENAKAKHREPDCKCPSVGPSLSKIINTTSGDTFPVIDMRFLLAASKPNTPHFQRELLKQAAVSKYQDGMKFVAISHVWSDGLMGTSETGLPACQIEHLANLAYTAATISAQSDTYQGPWYLWIDAMCIPADSRVRKLAITKMRQVYSNAALTIVLDEGLYRSPDYSNPYTTIFRLMTCVWSRRLWTLQELVLSKNVYIRFSVGLSKLSSLFENVLEGTKPPMDEENVQDLAELSNVPAEEVRRIEEVCRDRPANSIQALVLRELRSIPVLANMEPQISQVCRMLTLRDSSRRDDEFLAIAPLLGGDVSKLVNLSGEERVKEFWLQVGAVHRDVLMLDFPRLSIPGFRCLPMTMLSQTVQSPMQWKYDKCQITEKGICGRYWIYRWSSDDTSPKYIKINVEGIIVDREARQVIRVAPLDADERKQDDKGIDGILVLDQPADYAEVRTRPFRGLAICSTGYFHQGHEIFSPVKLLECRSAPPLKNWDSDQARLTVTGRMIEVIVG
ncbi:hypothetical protein N7528_008598 [Penicillium herquei]|nr:hypothetical protein N7528_008598 [Penicillium herquei]